jgi:hypothetical protein
MIVNMHGRTTIKKKIYIYIYIYQKEELRQCCLRKLWVFVLEIQQNPYGSLHFTGKMCSFKVALITSGVQTVSLAK